MAGWHHTLTTCLSERPSACVILLLLQVMQVLHAKPAFFWTLLVNSCMAYAVNLTNFLVTKYTSALTLQVSTTRRQSASSCTANRQRFCTV